MKIKRVFRIQFPQDLGNKTSPSKKRQVKEELVQVRKRLSGWARKEGPYGRKD